MAPKKKNRNLDAWEAEMNALDENGIVQDAGENTVPDVAVKSKKKDKKKDKKAKAAAAFNSDDDVELAALAADSDEAEEDAMVAQPKPRSKSKGKGKSLFAMVQAEEEEPEEELEEAEADEAEPSSRPLLNADTPQSDIPVAARILSLSAHPQADRLRVAELDLGPALGRVSVVTNSTEASEGQVVAVALPGCLTPGTGVAVAVAEVRGVASQGMLCSLRDLGWKASAKSALSSASLAVLEEGACAPGEDLPAKAPKGWLVGEVSKGKKKEKAAEKAEIDEEVEEEMTSGVKPKKKDKKKSKDVAAAFAALDLGLEEAGEEGSAVEEEDDGAVLVKKPKTKKKQGDLDLDALLAAGEREDAEDADLAVGEAKAKKKKKKKEADLDALLAELEAPEEPSVPTSAGATSVPTPVGRPQSAQAAKPAAPGGKKGGKGKGKKGKGGGEEDLDAILAELGMPAVEEAAPATAQAAKGGKPAPAAKKADVSTAPEAAGEEGEPADAAEAGEGKKKKKKKAGPKKEGGEEGAGPSAQPAKPKKVSAAVRRMQEMLEAQRAADAAAAAAAEALRLEEEEAERLAAEAEARRLADAERRKEERLARREQLRREGKLLSGKAKAEAERLARMREQFLRQAGVEVEESAARKRPVYGSMKKRAGPRKGGEQAGKGAPEEAVGPEAEAEAEATPEPEAEATPEPEAEATPEPEPEEDSAVDDWETMEEDAIVIPGQAAAEAPVAVAAAEEAEEEEEEEESEASGSESGSESGSSSSSSSESESESESELDSEEEMERRVEASRAIRAARLAAAMKSRDSSDLRSPICCILGHVDTGKTKILDNIRRTNVQDGEAGGITQQIGATYIPSDALWKRTEELRKGRAFELRLPGLLVIDTPGHESFSNLRSRGSGLCDIAVLVVDLMHGLEPQTVESLNLLKLRKTPFVVALNKVDRLYGWAPQPGAPIQDALAAQKEHVRAEFEQRTSQISLALNEQGLNVALYWRNKDPRSVISIVPTSAISGEGIPDLLQLLVRLTQGLMADKLTFVDDLQCTVLEVKQIEGLGTTIDVVLVNGRLREGDEIVVCGLGGPIRTTIRALLTPQPLREIRVKGSYQHHKELKAAMGVKIAAHHLESAVAGTQLLVVRQGDDVGALEHEVMEDMQDIFSSVDKSGEGVCVQGSTLGSLEALLEFLRSPEVGIPVSAINIGPVHKRDVMRANVMIERGVRKYGVILAFDVPVTREAREVADDLGVKVLTADIIYHLFDQFTAYLAKIKEDEQAAARADAVFPCILRIMPSCVFNAKDPIVVGVEIAEGIARVGTPICVPSQGGIDLGKIASMEKDHKPVEVARKGDSVAMKIEATRPEEAARLYGRHFTHVDDLVSRISRRSIDVLKDLFRDDLSRDDWKLVVRLKKVFGIE